MQQRAAVAAAPQGNDEPLTPVVIQADLTRIDQPAADEAPSGLEAFAEANAGPLDLNISQRDQSVRKDLALFGYDIFNRVPTTFAPVEGIPVPEGYVIGPGDNVVVQLFGNRNVEYNLVVTRDGEILIPEYGPVSIAGMAFDEAERLLTEGFERRVIGARAVITMGKLRTIQIRLAGDVVQPGIYTVGGLSTLIDAVLTTGGVASTGSLRNIQLIRNGRLVTGIDLYDLLLSGKAEQDPYLKHNDTIFVPPIGEVIYVGGEVQRPAIYELGDETTVGEVLDMAGGILPTASLFDSHLERVSASGHRLLIDFANAGTKAGIYNTPVRNGDFIRVLPLEDELKQAVLLTGHIRRPGAYQFTPGMLITDLIPSPEVLMPGADIDSVLVERENATTLSTEVHYVPFAQVMAAPQSEVNLQLAPRDKIVVFPRAGDRAQGLVDTVKTLRDQSSATSPASVFTIQGHIHHAGDYPLSAQARLLDVVALAGGIREGADLHYGLLVRTEYPSTDIEVFAFSLSAARRHTTTDDNPRVKPGDRLYVFSENDTRAALFGQELARLREQARFGAQEQSVTGLGELRFPGTYPLVAGMRASDLVCAAGGLARKAFALTAELSRISHTASGASRAQHTPLDPKKLVDICHAKRQLENGQISRVDYRSLYLNELTNPVMASTDQLAFREKIGWVERMTVELSGELVTPGVYAVDRGETLCEVVKRAGGLTDSAYDFGAVFTRRSVRRMQQEVIDGLKAQLDDLMINLSLSHSFNNQEKSSHEWAGKQDYLRTIKQIETATASGRMVIDLEKAVECDEFADVVLEDGDQLHVPTRPNYVQVAGQVYVPTSHLYQRDRKIADYIELSGGHTILGELKHAYVIQANGEVLNYRGSRQSSRIKRDKVSPGAKVYVPIDVDRMNTTEKAQTWVQTLINSALIAGVIL